MLKGAPQYIDRMLGGTLAEGYQVFQSTSSISGAIINFRRLNFS